MRANSTSVLLFASRTPANCRTNCALCSIRPSTSFNQETAQPSSKTLALRASPIPNSAADHVSSPVSRNPHLTYWVLCEVLSPYESRGYGGGRAGREACFSGLRVLLCPGVSPHPGPLAGAPRASGETEGLRKSATRKAQIPRFRGCPGAPVPRGAIQKFYVTTRAHPSPD